MSFDQFALDPRLLAGIRDMGYDKPTPIQEQAIPQILTGRDVLGIAQTGTGKTAAFLLPVLHRLLQSPRGSTRCLILAPTRELAMQIEDNRIGLSYHAPLSGSIVYGGADYNAQERALKGKPDIVTATPGRLLDFLFRGMPDLSKLEVLILDEADRMLDMGFMPDIEKILRRMPEVRQNLLFSATMPPAIERFANQILRDPLRVVVGPTSRPVDLVEQEVVSVGGQDKIRLLLRLLEHGDLRSVLVFVSTKVGASRVWRDLVRAGVPSGVIHSDRTQQERFQALEAFRHGEHRVLVATDVAARGIDVDGISHVVNLDVPRSPEDYVHRIGRTGRAGESGHAMTFVAPDEERKLAAIEHLLKKTFTRRNIDGFRAPPRGDARGDGRGGGRGAGRGDGFERRARFDAPRRGPPHRSDRPQRPDRSGPADPPRQEDHPDRGGGPSQHGDGRRPSHHPGQGPGQHPGDRPGEGQGRGRDQHGSDGPERGPAGAGDLGGSDPARRRRRRGGRGRGRSGPPPTAI
ncbi:MAG: DEAD/DEAH box helicase [Planctomycetes bacterium]|nr:DEAD/DEAH box helicase [Planctomycetota bacterium]MCC7171543.1 DEAD/DEAH box helicase [Planctomycetota bacterium]